VGEEAWRWHATWWPRAAEGQAVRCGGRGATSLPVGSGGRHPKLGFWGCWEVAAKSVGGRWCGEVAGVPPEPRAAGGAGVPSAGEGGGAGGQEAEERKKWGMWRAALPVVCSCTNPTLNKSSKRNVPSNSI
jgi:hypothetical protein